jgi:DNA (cytosine-5)-methyltransferase 1
MAFKGIDLFCGGGGSSWGARNAGVEMVGAVDAWDMATATYEDNFPTAKGNVVTARLDDASGPKIFPKQLGKIDLVIASPECTHHSIARGAKPPDEESRRSGWYVMGFIEKLKPRWVVLENVTPMSGWPGFDDLLGRLKRTLKGVKTFRLDASEFGVPQSRKRLFIVCDRERNLDDFAIGGQVRSTRFAVSARSILDPKRAWTADDLFRPGRAGSTVQRAKAAIEELGEGKDFLIVYYGSDKAGGWQRLDRPLRTITTLDRFGLVQWRRGTPTLRMLQVPELQRAMGLEPGPDGREFRLEHGTRRDKVKLLGNGVCAPVMERVVLSLTNGATLEARQALANRPRSREVRPGNHAVESPPEYWM